MKNKKQYEEWLIELFNGDEDRVIESFDNPEFQQMFLEKQ